MREYKHKQYFIRHFLILFSIICISLTLFFIAGLKFWEYQRTNEIKAGQQRKVLSEQHFLEYSFKESVYDLEIMTENQFFKDVLTKRNDDKKIQDCLEGLVKDLFVYKKNYYQLRFINNKGMEVFRMERDHGNPVITLREKLQDKSKRYYFQETMKLEKGSIYISPFDLNIEHEKLEKPFRPMIRICIPVFLGMEKVGINVLNYDGTRLLENFRINTSRKIGMTYLINKDGYFLNAPDTSLEWGFMFPNKKEIMISGIFEKDAGLIQETTQGQFETANGIYTVATVYPFGNSKLNEGDLIPWQDYTWKILSVVPKTQISFTSFIPFSILLFFCLAALLGGVMFAYYYSRVALRKYQAQESLIESEKNLRTANQVKDQFFSILSHDLKNASGSISSYLELINEDFDSFSQEERKMHLNTVAHAASMLTKLLFEILDWARLQQDKIEITPEELDVASLFEEQKKQVEMALKNKELLLELDLDAGLKVLADKNMIKTVLRNLINNAIKFSYRNNRIILSGKRKEEKAELKVTDFGTGMDETRKNKIFDLGANVHMPGTEYEEGSGFGLKLVMELVRKNRGSIVVESIPGKGSCFIISLPSVIQ